MKTLLKLLIAAVAMNAVVRGALVTWDDYRFKAEAQEIVERGSNQSPAELQTAILAAAGARNIPLEAAALSVTRSATTIVASGTYTREVEAFPSYIYPATFSFELDALVLPGSLTNRPPR